MYTHIGNGKVLKNKEIIGIFNVKTLQPSRDNKRMMITLAKMENEEETPQKKMQKEITVNSKSVIVMDSDSYYENHYELSMIAVSTLKKRLEKGLF